MRKKKLHFKLRLDFKITIELVEIIFFAFHFDNGLGWITICGICLYWEKY